jgi:tetratricopeptide (TPR) repeat protein
MEILKKAWTICRPDAVATTALTLYNAPSAGDTQRRQVEALVAEAVRRRPGAVLLAAKLGVIWISQSRFDDAEALFRRLLISDPDNADALNNLAWLLALQEQSKAQEALGLIDRAIEIQGPTSSLLDTRAVVLIRAGQPEKSIQNLREAQELDTGNPSSVVHLAWAYQALGQADEARKALKKAEDLGWKVAKSDPLERTFIDKIQRDLGMTSH